MAYLASMTKYLTCTVELPENTRQISPFASLALWYLVFSRHPPGGERGRELRDTAISSQVLEIPDTPVWPPTERALSHKH
eukprot:6212341-Pleurochrysis_carterae.AAC.5